MIIKKVMIGNSIEAFIEDRFTKGFNIISSDDNNKGKTLVIQSMMYALGNEPIFPDTFKFNEYYHIVTFETGSQKDVTICRKKNTFTVLYNSSIQIFDGITELKYFFHNSLFGMTTIKKKRTYKIVDPVLFYQIFFIGQDSKDTSNVIMHGYYNKNDFYSMLTNYKGFDDFNDEIEDTMFLKKKKAELKNEKKELLKENKILKSVLPSIEVGSISANKESIKNKLKLVNNLKNEITEYSVERNRAISRKVKNEVTLKELRSLNKTLQVGKLKCLDCESENIGYSSADNSITFDIASTEIRNQILSSIEKKIEMYDEKIQTIGEHISKLQLKLKELLSDDDVSIESLFLYKKELIDSSDADLRINEIEDEIEKIEQQLIQDSTKNNDLKEKVLSFYERIYKRISDFYSEVDPESNRSVTSLFSKKKSVYSGVESTVFYLSKLYSLQKEVNHDFPIIMDYFRDGELSTTKERKVIDLFSNLPNQKIFTATLKDQEANKYSLLKNINNIDYTSNTPHKLLGDNYIDDFKSEIEKLSIKING